MRSCVLVCVVVSDCLCVRVTECVWGGVSLCARMWSVCVLSGARLTGCEGEVGNARQTEGF